jgi:transposase InsO family protein
VLNQAAIDLHTDPKRQQLAANIFIRACSQEVLAYTTIDDRTSARLIMKSITKELRLKGEARYLKLSEQLSTLKYDGLEPLAAFKLKVDAIFTELEATDVKPSFQLMRMIHLKTSMGRAFTETIGNFDSSTTSNDAWDRLERKDEALRRLAPGGAILTNPPPATIHPSILAFIAAATTASVTCSNCNKKGHVINDYYRLHPEKAPPSWRKAGDPNARTGRGGRGGRGRGSRGRGAPRPSRDAPRPSEGAQGLAAIDPDDQRRVLLAAIDSNSKEKSSCWTLDSGATYHLINKPSALHRYTPYDKPITVQGITGELKIIGEGCVDVLCRVGDQVTTITLSNVGFAPKSIVNLLSVHQLSLKGIEVSFPQGGNKAIGLLDKSPLFEATYSNGQYKLEQEGENETRVSFLAQSSLSGVEAAKLWHQRLGHLSFALLSTLSGTNGLPKFPASVRTLFCNTCALIKSQKIPSRVSPTRATKRLEIIHSDVCGWISPSAFGGYRYFVTFRDDFSRYVWAYCLRNKDDVFETFTTWKAQVERESGCNVILLRSDGGGEYDNERFSTLFKETSIQWDPTQPYSADMNGTAERLNRIILAIVKTMLTAAGITSAWWHEAVGAAVYLVNRRPTATLQGRTPFELWHDRKPSYHNLIS